MARERSIALVEELISTGPLFSLQALCQCLQTRYRFLVKQLIGTLRAETGDLQPDGRIIITIIYFHNARVISETEN